jgi:dethiobiotin synthetase
MHCFITGTDTGVGKTFFTCTLLSAWAARGHRTAGFKPISTGTREDAEQLQAAAANPLTLEEINPLHFPTPLSPWIAAELENHQNDLSAVSRQLRQAMLPYTHVAIEGTGGWLTPITRETTMADLAKELGYPVVIVTRATLGTLNHTLLTVESIRSSGLPILGLVINHHQAPDDQATRTNPSALARLTGLPTLNLQRETPSLLALPAWLD